MKKSSGLTEITRHVLEELEKSAQPFPGMPIPGMPPGGVPGAYADPAAAQKPAGKGSKMEERLSNLEAAVAEILKKLNMADPEKALADTITQQANAGAGASAAPAAMPAGPMDPMSIQALQQLKMGMLVD